MSEVTQLLNRWQEGDQSALNELVPLVYDELKGVARARMRAEAGYRTLDPTALLHETFLLLSSQNRSKLKNRAQLFALAARMMRRVLIDHARGKRAEKRGGDARQVGLEEAEEFPHEPWTDPLLMDDALIYLARIDGHLCSIVELKLFGGFDMGEISKILDLAPATTYRHWKMAKAHLFAYFRERR